MLLKLTKAIAREIPEPETLFADAPADRPTAADPEQPEVSRSGFLPGEPLPDPTAEDSSVDPADDPQADDGEPADPADPARTESAPVFTLSPAERLRNHAATPLTDLQARLQAQNQALGAALRGKGPPNPSR